MADLPLGYEIAAKSVEWNGVTFRSTLECAWAKKFACFPNVYEPQQFDFGKYGKYTPDFVLFTDVDADKDGDSKNTLFIEIKPRPPLFHEIVKTYKLQQLVDGPVVFFIGQPGGSILPNDPRSNVLDAAGVPWKMWSKSNGSIMKHRCEKVRGL